MRPKVDKVFKLARKDTTFHADTLEADGDNVPSRFASPEVKIAYAAIYYGYYLGKYGTKATKEMLND